MSVPKWDRLILAGNVALVYKAIPSSLLLYAPWIFHKNSPRLGYSDYFLNYQKFRRKK